MTAAPAATGEHLLAAVTAAIGQVLEPVTEVGQAMTTLAAAASAGRRPLRRADLAALRPLVARVLARHHGFAAGAGVVLAPQALADAPRWIDWWWADRGIGQLQVDLDPGSAEFYDYTTTEWYREPARTGQPCIAGPYVDYICTREYTFTVAVPVVDDGRFMGVAGADILAGEVERMVLPGLSRLGRASRPAVLVSGSGRVIASSSARILPGEVLGPGGQGGTMTAAGPLPWMLLGGPAGPAAPRVSGDRAANAGRPSGESKAE
jgi:Cache domain